MIEERRSYVGIAQELIDFDQVLPEDRPFVEGLKLTLHHDHLRAHTPHGVREVEVGMISFQPIIYYKIENRTWAAWVPGLNPLLLPKREEHFRSYEPNAAIDRHANPTRRKIATHLK